MMNRKIKNKVLAFSLVGILVLELSFIYISRALA